MHWILIRNRKILVDQFDTRKEAEDFAINKYPMRPEQAERLRTSLVVKIQRVGLVEIVACECTSGKHEGEI